MCQWVRGGPCPYCLWNITTLSALRSESSSFFPFSMTSGCFRTNSQPMWEKKKPLKALWGSASVSEYLWWTRWSLAHSKMSFCNDTDHGLHWIHKERLALHNNAKQLSLSSIHIELLELKLGELSAGMRFQMHTAQMTSIFVKTWDECCWYVHRFRV